MQNNGKDKSCYIFGMLLILAALAVFIGLRLKQPKATEADLSALEAELKAAGLTKGTASGTEAMLKRNFDLLPSSWSEVLYFMPDNFMNVDEILLIRLPDGSSAESVRRAMEKRLETMKNTFENYGTDQFSLMQKAQIYANGPYVCYTAGHCAEEAMALIRSRIER